MVQVISTSRNAAIANSKTDERANRSSFLRILGGFFTVVSEIHGFVAGKPGQLETNVKTFVFPC